MPSDDTTSENYRCLVEECGESFQHKVKARDHAREHMPRVGNYGMYDFITVVDGE